MELNGKSPFRRPKFFTNVLVAVDEDFRNVGKRVHLSFTMDSTVTRPELLTPVPVGGLFVLLLVTDGGSTWSINQEGTPIKIEGVSSNELLSELGLNALRVTDERIAQFLSSLSSKGN